MQVVLITGCSSGFGYLSALTFGRKGYQVYATMRNVTKSQELVEEAESEKLAVSVLSMDVSDETSVHQAVSKVLQKEKKIDILVNNAGVGCLGPVECLDLNLLNYAFETNFYGPLRTTRAVLPTMRNQKSGVIVNVASIDGRIPGRPINWGYAATKHALGIMSDALALEVEPFNIKVRQIEPGFFATKIFENRALKEEMVKQQKAISESPYKDMEYAVKSMAESNVKQAADPQIVADAIVEAAESEHVFPVHYPVGADAEEELNETRTKSEKELAESWKRSVGLFG
ncbi:SDR family oxidoreductase [Salibacterium sp. K-3]